MGWAVTGLEKYLINCTTKIYPYTELQHRRIESDSDNDVFFIFEIGNPQHCGLKTRDLRVWFPNAKFITFCSDTIYYQINRGKNFWQMDPYGIDLHLEIMPQSLERFLDAGIDAELWMWTGSEKLFKQAGQYYRTHSFEKLYDFIGVFHPNSMNNQECWRYHAIKYIKDNGLNFTNGGGNGHEDGDFDRLFQHYMQSWFTLGTTSHNRPELTKLGCMKGFRDWLGPILGNVLIYDNHPNIGVFNNQEWEVVPTYEYDSYESILKLANKLKFNKDKYINYIMKQNDWAWENTIERQLVNIMLKKGWITSKDIYESFRDNDN